VRNSGPWTRSSILTSSSIVTETVTSFGATRTTQVTSTLYPVASCPPSSATVAKRQVVDAACPCKVTTVLTTETAQGTNTRTKIAKVCCSLPQFESCSPHLQTPTTSTSIVTATQAAFLLQSSFDEGFAYIDEQDGYYDIQFGPCVDPSSAGGSALFSLNGTRLIGPEGAIANNGQCCGGSGLVVGFSELSNPGIQALTCDVIAGALSCGVGSATSSNAICGGVWTLGGSQVLCDSTTLTVVS
jgi:hypothetical protein